MRPVVVLSLIFAFDLASTASREKRLALETFECIYIAPMCVNASCSMTKLDYFKYNLSAKAFIQRPQPKVILHIRNYHYTNKKEWKSGNVNIKIDYCDFAKGANNPILTIFVPDLREQLGNMLRPCPYEGKIDVKNFTIEMGKRETPYPIGTRQKVDLKFLTGKLAPVFGVILFTRVVYFTRIENL